MRWRCWKCQCDFDEGRCPECFPLKISVKVTITPPQPIDDLVWKWQLLPMPIDDLEDKVWEALDAAKVETYGVTPEIIADWMAENCLAVAGTDPQKLLPHVTSWMRYQRER